MTPREEKVVSMLKRRFRNVAIVLEDIHDPHNAAAIMRTADALGIQDVRLVFEQEGPWNPRRIGKSSSSSANKWLSFQVYKGTQSALAALAAEGFSSIATVLVGADALLGEYDFTRHEKVALWVGNEHRGVSDAARAGAVTRVVLPMQGMVESLNVSVAAALCLYEVTRQRKALKDAYLPEDVVHTLAQELMAR